MLKGIPIFEILGNGKIFIDDNVTLYSTRKQYFAHLASPVRLFAEGNGTISIGKHSRLNGVTIHSRRNISIGEKCLIAANTSILDSDGHQLCLDDPEMRIMSTDQPQEVIIEDCVWVGLNCIILKGVRIGRGSIVGAGSVVTKSIPPLSIAAGNPARIIQNERQKRT